MDLKSTIAIILKDLEDARNILDDLKNYPEVPAIQVELAKAKCRSASEVIKVLVETPTEPEKREPQETDKLKEQKDNKDSVADSVTDSVADSVTDSVTDSVADSVTDSVTDPDSGDTDLASEIIDELIQPHEIPVHVDRSDKEGKILADKFSRQASINENLSGKRHEDDSAELTKLKPISDIKAAIGINEKFMFIRELFKGDQDLYNNALEELNRSKSIDDAFNKLSDIVPGSGNSEAFDLLIDLVKRKLSSK